MNYVYKFYFSFLLIFSIANLVCMETLSDFEKNRKHERLLSLSFNKFCKTPNRGWQEIEDPIEAGNLVIQYLSYHQNLCDSYKADLYFDAGHLFAWGDDIKMSIYCLKKSGEYISRLNQVFVDREILRARSARVCYIKIVMAFLEKDKIYFDELFEDLKSYSDLEESNISYANIMAQNFYKTCQELFVKF